MNDSFVFRKEWVDNVGSLPVEVQDKVLSDLVRYGLGFPLEHKSEVVVNALVKSRVESIDFSISKYKEKVAMSKGAGRKKSIDEEQIAELVEAGWKAGKIADALGCSSASIYHSSAWKNRKVE